MRVSVIILGAALLGMPEIAAANCPQGDKAFNVSCERGVTVYRGKIPKVNRNPIEGRESQIVSGGDLNTLQNRLIAQSAQIAALSTQQSQYRATRSDPFGPFYFGSRFFVPHSYYGCLLYTSPSPRDKRQSRMPSSA